MSLCVIYCRKSSEAEDRQILSLPSQLGEMELLRKRTSERVFEAFAEAQSAKAPGRPEFERMMRLVESGKADTILCWKLDRLARNPIDGGRVIWAVNHYGAKIITPTQVFQKNDGSTLLMWVELGMAHKYVEDLSINVKRGLAGKLQMRWMPGRAPMGYLNARSADGIGILVEDPARFPLVRRMWELLLTGQYTVRAIADIVRDDWKLTSKPTKHSGKRPMSFAAVYRLFTLPFYYGVFEYPVGSGSWYKGAHPPIITEEEFDKAQRILGRTNRPRPKKHAFRFVGMMRCGACGCAITAEEKFKRPKNGNVHHYIYYHCTKKKIPRCTQRSIEEKTLLAQMQSFLFSIDLPQSYCDWVVKNIGQLAEEEHSDEIIHLKRLAEAIDKTTQSLKELTKMRYSQLITDEEFALERSLLNLERDRLEAATKSTRLTQAWKEEMLYVYRKLASIHDRFIQADATEQKRILLETSSNLTILDGKLIVKAMEPFFQIHEAYARAAGQKGAFEPPKKGSARTPSPFFSVYFSIGLRHLEDVRTYFIKRIKKRLEKEAGLDTSSDDETSTQASAA
jgi:site-specific DNA recombinase